MVLKSAFPAPQTSYFLPNLFFFLNVIRNFFPSEENLKLKLYLNYVSVGEETIQSYKQTYVNIIIVCCPRRNRMQHTGSEFKVGFRKSRTKNCSSGEPPLDISLLGDVLGAG